MIQGIMLQTVTQFVTSPYIIWFPIVMIAALAIIGVLAMMYMLSTFAGRGDLRAWSRVKIYEILLSVVLVLLFFALAVTLFGFDFKGLFGSVGLLPTACKDASVATDLFSVAMCNLHQFNNNILTLNFMTYYAGLSATFVPSLKINGTALIEHLTLIQGIGVDDTLVPIPAFVNNFLGYLIDIMYSAYVLSQVQLLLLGASLLLFSLFMAIGLIARIFVITRSFGGSMIALGAGLGVVYPLLVCMTYGYVNVGMDYNAGIFVTSTMSLAITTLIVSMVPFFSGAVLPMGVAAFQQWLSGVLTYFGLAAAGLLFVPFLNFAIVDVFVIDFSKAIGEKVDFMKLLTNVI
ncbi:Uncharacterised protein [uncultured archaeon]|nr:Uncharacterised protein [uncultured archaeon]